VGVAAIDFYSNRSRARKTQAAGVTKDADGEGSSEKPTSLAG